MTDQQQITSWIVPLLGHEFDLEDLPHWLAGQDVHVAKREEGYVLVIPSENIGKDYNPVRTYAKEQLELINGVGRLLSEKFRPVSLARKLYGVDSAGKILHTVVAVETAETRAKAGPMRVVLGNQVQPDAREAAAFPLMRAASHSGRAHDALIIIGRPILTWSELYLLFELVKADVGSQMFELGWIPLKDANLFTHTANSYATLRISGRHGKDRGDPPENPMPHHIAVSLMRVLVFAWLRHLDAQVDFQTDG